MKVFKFYDTCSLLLQTDSLFTNEQEQDHFAISSITLVELDHIKTAANKDEHIKFLARKLLHLLNEHQGQYDVHIFTEKMLQPILDKGIPVTADTQILATALDYDSTQHPDETIFVTNDLGLKNIANLFFGEDSIESVITQDDNYTGWKIITMNDDEMSNFYSNQSINHYNLYVNEYLIIKNINDDIVDKLVWTGEGYRRIDYGNFTSTYFGDVKPIKNDVYQAILCDSFKHNKLTMVRGPAGSGKTFLSLAYLLFLLEKHKIDKIVVFCNTIATKNSAKLGYYPGTRDEKLLDSQIGNLLSSKLGGRFAVEQMINEEKLILLPFSDLRGYDTTGMHAGIYISEAQNLDIPLIKLALQRIGEDSICIIDGDDKTQVDLIEYEDANNGMKRVSKVFRGQDIYGEITLQEVHRSKIAKIAEGL